MWRVIFTTGCDAVLVDENRKTYKVRLEWPEHYEEIIHEAFEKGQEITFADYREKEKSDFCYCIHKEETPCQKTPTP